MLSTCNITVSAVNGDGARTDDVLIAEANRVSSGDILRQLGTLIAKGNRFECPTCKAYPPSATFADDMGDSIKPSRWRCTSCDGGGSPVDLVGLVRGYNATDAARWILRLSPVEAELSPIGDVLPARDDIGQEPAQEITTSIDSANALENEVPAFVGSETRAEINVMSNGSTSAAVRPRGSDDRQELRLMSDQNGSSNSVDSVSKYVSIVLMDRKPREFRFIKPGRRGSKSWTWTPDKTEADIGRVLSDAHDDGYNAYVTINPLRTDAVKRDKAQSDEDIERRAFIPVDVDPKRPSGTLATQAQTEAAKTVADQVIEWYRVNFPDHTEPLIGCSGSGYQILIPCDIPADREGDEIVSGLLKLLARTFDSEDAHVDTAVANRSRIMRVCGTEAFYSDGSRFGQVVSHPTTHPTEWRVLTVDDLRPIVPKNEPKPERTTAMIRTAMPTNGTPRGNMAKRLDSYIKPALAEITDAADGTKHETLFKKTAHIANYVAGAGLQSHESEYKTRILDALRENAGHVGSWEAANTTIDDAWAKGITDPKPLPDRERPAKAIQNREVEDSGAANVNGSGMRRDALPQVIFPLSYNDPSRIFAEIIPHLADAGVYYRDGSLCRIVQGDSVNIRGVGKLSVSGPAIDTHDADSILPVLCQSIDFQAERLTKRGPELFPATPKAAFLRWFLRLRNWPDTPYLAGIASGPFLRHDGTVCTASGYDSESGWYLDYDGESLDIPANPTRAQAEDACRTLLALVDDFEWKSESQQCGFLAYLLTLVARPGIEGAVPAFVFTASTPGAGKTLLANVANIIAFGHAASGYSPPQARHESDAADEWKKMLFAFAGTGNPSLVVSNYPSGKPVGNAAIDGMITDMKVIGRPLGTSKTKESAWVATMAFTGNNLSSTADFSFRSIWAVLEPSVENPRERTGFKIGDLEGFAREHRANLLRKALIILRWHAADGKPPANGRHFGSFERWAETVRDAIMQLTGHDVTQNGRDAVITDQESDELGTLLTGLREYFEWRKATGKPQASFTVAEMHGDLTDSNNVSSWSDLREVVDAGLSLRSFNTSVGRLLPKYRGRVSGGLKLNVSTVNKKHYWRIETVCP